MGGAPRPQGASAAALGPGAICGAWEGGMPEPQWSTAAADVEPGEERINLNGDTSKYETKLQHTRQSPN